MHLDTIIAVCAIVLAVWVVVACVVSLVVGRSIRIAEAAETGDDDVFAPAAHR